MTDRPPRQPPGASSTGTGTPEGLSRNLHDSFFKSVFGDPVLAAGELGAVLPPELVARIDWPSLAPAPANFVGALFRQRVGDLVFQARFKAGGELLLWCLLEHQRRQDPWMILRIVDTESKMWQRWQRLHPRHVQLPPIVPVVVYHGHEPWTSATAMRELYALPQDTQAAFGDHLLSCSFVLDDLSRVDDDSLRSRRMEIFAKLSLLALARAGAADFIDHLVTHWREELRQALSESDSERLLQLLEYIYFVNSYIDEKTMRRQLVAVAGPHAEDTMMSLGERLVQKGIEKGIERGVEKGQREMLLKQLVQRFGVLPAAVTARVNQAGAADLGRWAERILDATSLDDVFAGA